MMHDVIISGAGPSGSQCAEVLAKAGYSVVLIERDANWRKPCGGSVSSRVLKLYPQIKKLNIPKIRGGVLYSADYHRVEYRRKDNLFSTVMDRLELDNIMRDAAIDVGAELFDKNLAFDFISKNQEKLGIKTKSPSGVKEYHGKIIIVADGMSSKLAIKSGLRSKWKTEEIGTAKCAIMEGANNLDEEFIHVYFKPYMGYGWIFPLGSNRFNIGCGIVGEDILRYNLNDIYTEFIGDPKIKEFIPGSNYKIIWSGSYPLPTVGVLENSLYDNNLMLIGDTAGFISPINGEGIYASVYSGKAAAEVAIEALENEDYSKNTLKKYKKHSDIKHFINSFKMRRSVAKFFVENKGVNLNKMFELAEKDSNYKEQLIGLFLTKADITPSKDFFTRIKEI